MIGIIVVSHSPRLAEAAIDLGLQMVHDEQPPIRIAAGSAGTYGTDAAAVAAAMDDLADADGVVIITDLGSAVLSASLALDLRASAGPVAISHGPFVEGITAALVCAANGGTLEEVTVEAQGALTAKQANWDTPDAPTVLEPAEPGDVSEEEPVINPLGLHSRPAAMLVRTASTFTAGVDVTNLTTGHGPVNASSMVGLLSLGAVEGHRLRFDAHGSDALDAVVALRELVADGFGEVPAPAPA